MAIVRLKASERDIKVSELFNMFKLPLVNSQGYQTKTTSELMGGSAAMNSTEVLRLKAVNEIRKWIRLSV